jgi:hypothetical protein
MTTELYEKNDVVQRTAFYTPIENTNVPFVFATAQLGLKKCVMPITTKDGKVRHTGKKVPEITLEMVRIMQSAWRLTAFDPGEGLGEYEIIDRSLKRKRPTP